MKRKISIVVLVAVMMLELVGVRTPGWMLRKRIRSRWMKKSVLILCMRAEWNWSMLRSMRWITIVMAMI